MDTIKIENKKNTLFIAHRGASCLETENTCAAFVAAGNRSYYGIESDVHKTSCNSFVIIHDDYTGRVCGTDNLCIENSDFSTLKNLTLVDKITGMKRNDLRIPTLEDYISVCKKYSKVAVLEFKNRIERQFIKIIAEIIKEKFDYLNNVIFISFEIENLIDLRKDFPETTVQYLIDHEITDELITILADNKFDLDCYYPVLSENLVNILHKNNIKINCWTVDDKDYAEILIDWGVDFITSNCLE